MAEYCFCEAKDSATDRVNQLVQDAAGFRETAEAADDPRTSGLLEQCADGLEQAANTAEAAATELQNRCATGNYSPGDARCLGCYALGGMNRPDKRATIARLDGNA